ncbi:MAG TPA: DUF4145 domain-containing protein [Longimicrobium sp.]|jgi:hypothetical protein
MYHPRLEAQISKDPLDHPEVRELFRTLLQTLLNESGRGAILIGTAHVDNHLRALFEVILPASHGKKKRQSLLSYPGALSSFSARIELAYVLRLIPRVTYDALHALRQVRNDLAHSPDSFDIHEQQERLQRMYSLGPDMPRAVKRMAMEALFEYKTRVAADTARRIAEENPDWSLPPLETKHDFSNYAMEHPEVMQAMERQLPLWELAHGVTLLCSMIVHQKDKLRSLLAGDMLLSHLQRPAE